jgi:hypothetical protein
MGKKTTAQRSLVLKLVGKYPLARRCIWVVGCEKRNLMELAQYLVL